MISIKALRRKYKVQLLLAYIPFLTSLVISFANVLPKYLIDYKVPTILILLIMPLLYSYNLLLKNHSEELEVENNVLKKTIEDLNILTKTSSSIQLENYSFDSKIGYYQHKKTGELFCSPCVLKNIPAQLKEYDNYWRCTNCGYCYYKPGYKPVSKPIRRRNDDDNSVIKW